MSFAHGRFILVLGLLACASGKLGTPPRKNSPARGDAAAAPSGGGSDGGDGFGNAAMRDAAALPDTGPVLADLVLTPSEPKLTIEGDTVDATLQFKVESVRGQKVEAHYEVEDEDYGTIDQTGLFTASGKRAGMTVVVAHVGERLLRTPITISIAWQQNGATPDPASARASGGYGGVGGEGPGGAVADAVKQTLDKKPTADGELKFLYPYDHTVFPLGLLSPLLMWTGGKAAVADGVRIHIASENFDYLGYFGRPSMLAAGAAFVRHPIPQEVWETATRSVAGGGLAIEVVLAKDGVAYGPISITTKIAAGTLKGTLYYQSYGTNLAKNEDGAIGGDGRFGGATLAIKPGALGPELVAGGNGGHDQCRVCHSVSSDGSRMTVQWGDPYAATSSYNLRNNNAEMPYTQRTQLAWIGLTPDGAYGLGNGYLPAIGETDTQFYDMTNGTMVPTSGLREIATRAAFPMFSHDGKRVAFNFYAGPGNMITGPADQKKLLGMDFDPMTRVFSNPQVLYAGDKPAGWPSFSPTGSSVYYEVEIKRGSENGLFRTRWGGQGELWWTNLETGMAHALDRANGLEAGKSYLPESKDNHMTDTLLNYEPTVAPVVSGGYAWMVFNSRRLYGNVATIDPWFSDPREHDLTSTPTTKKLWVAAIDLDVHTPEFNMTVGDDPSHPAFYLPGQELLAGNTRGFWVVDPCKADGTGCESGVECCSGFCQKDETTNKFTCGRKKYQCAREFDHCETAKDCCDPMAACVNHVCSKIVVQ